MGSQDRWIVTLSEAADVAEDLIGGKAAKLARLMRGVRGSRRVLHHDRRLRAIRDRERLGGLHCHGVGPQVVGKHAMGRAVGRRTANPL